MSRKNRMTAKKGPVWKQSSIEATLSQMPKYNGYASGYGIHGDTKYNRNKSKREFKRELDRSSLPICAAK